MGRNTIEMDGNRKLTLERHLQLTHEPIPTFKAHTSRRAAAYAK